MPYSQDIIATVNAALGDDAIRALVIQGDYMGLASRYPSLFQVRNGPGSGPIVLDVGGLINARDILLGDPVALAGAKAAIDAHDVGRGLFDAQGAAAPPTPAYLLPPSILAPRAAPAQSPAAPTAQAADLTPWLVGAGIAAALLWWS